ncbi:formin 2 domain-containing protein [Cryptosporidium ubiquitum]|uniref:Formin 2 domain-containing protein n=1 Tax=Cryptosporidium ubiquitum TaxID=857276 RepID=A0A1J4MHF6_9CRYT|nr:formin 2 domain-containing protein [Cryptosporidium ubiquitum]OII73673.1 formin 2 domain-containing protein [Cryptosporidium ubiquitum]
MITSLVSRILGSSGTGSSSGPNIGNDSSLKISEERSIYCASSLTTFYRPKRLKIAILDHIPCNIDSLSIELFTIQKSGNFKEFIMSHIHDMKKSKVPRQTLIMNGYSFYSVISSSRTENCQECANNVCSSLVVDFTRNADNGESTYLIFQGEMILRIYDRKNGLNIYSLARGGNPDDVIHITKDDIILSIPNSFAPSQCFKLDLIMYSAIGWARHDEINRHCPTYINCSLPKNENINQNKQFSVSLSQNLTICSKEESPKRGSTTNKDDSNIEKISCTNTSTKNDSNKGTVHSNKERNIHPLAKAFGSFKTAELSNQPDSSDNPESNEDPKPEYETESVPEQTSGSKPGTSQLVALLRAKAPPLPLNIKSPGKPKAFPLKGSEKDSKGKSIQDKKKVLPLGRRIHWKPLTEEMAQKTIFREILYTSLNSHTQSPPVSPSDSSNLSSPVNSSIEDLQLNIMDESKTGTASPEPDSVSPMAITDIHMANTLVHMETLSRVFTKTGNTMGAQGGTLERLNTGEYKEVSNKISSPGSFNSPDLLNQDKCSDLSSQTKKSYDNKNGRSSKSSKDEQISQSSNTSSQKQLPLTFLSQKRAQNMAIVLARLSVPTDYIIEILNSFNISSLTLEDYERIEQVLPTEMELEKIKSNSKQELHQLEQFLSQFSHISNPMTRLRFLKFEHILDASEFDIQRNLNTLYSASVQIRNSNKLRLILKAFLLLGNYVNHGINFSTMSNISSISHVANNGSINWSLLETKGFSFSSLLRLVEFKTTIDPSFTALHYIIANLSLTNPKLNLNQFSTDLHAVSEASKISVEALFSCINDMRKELAILEVEKQKFTNDRVENLFESYSKRLDALVEGYHRIVEKVVDTALYFGQNLPEGNRASIIQPFFETMNIFILQFSSCCKDIREKPSRFSPLLVDSSLVFPNDKSLNSSSLSLIHAPSKINSTNTSSISSTPLVENSPNESLVKIPDITDSNCPEKTENKVLDKKEIQPQYNSNSKNSKYKESFSSNMNNKSKKEAENLIIIHSSRNNAIKLPIRPPPPITLKNPKQANYPL